MAPKTRTYLIESWSGRVYKARKNYCCDLCGGIIPRGTSYVRDVVRDGPDKGKDPLRNIHKHHNCETPWWQVAQHPRRLQNLGRLPHRLPTPAEYPDPLPHVVPMVIRHPLIGTIVWTMPEGLGERIALCGDKERKMAAIGEIEHAIIMLLTALKNSAGHQRKSRELEHALESVATLVA